MFKSKINFADEIAESMQSNLSNALIKKEASDNGDEKMKKFSSALDQLNQVAILFDELGLDKEAEAATILLEVVAAKKKVKKKTKSKSTHTKSKSKSSPAKKKKTVDEAVKDLDSEKMLDNLKHKGWVFNADDGLDVELEPAKEDMPDDYETCGDCGFDHEYSPSESNHWHKTHPGSYKGIPEHEDNKEDEESDGDFDFMSADDNFAKDIFEGLDLGGGEKDQDNEEEEDEEDFEDD